MFIMILALRIINLDYIDNLCNQSLKKYFWKDEKEKTGIYYKCLRYVELMTDPRTLYLMINRIKAEKNSEAFLSKVKETLELKIKQMEKGEEE